MYRQFLKSRYEIIRKVGADIKKGFKRGPKTCVLSPEKSDD